MFLKSSVSLKQEIKCSRIIDFIRILYTVTCFQNGYAKVLRQDSLWNFMNRNGSILYPNQWFNTILASGKIKVVVIKHKRFFLDNKNQLHCLLL